MNKGSYFGAVAVLVFGLSLGGIALGCTPQIWDIKASRIAGRVVFRTGEPIPDAVVKVFRTGRDSDKLVAQTNADQNGFYSITHIPRGKYTIRARGQNSDEGYGSLELSNRPESSSEQILFKLGAPLECNSEVKLDRIDPQKLATEVKNEFLHAWKGYKKYAWGNDDLKPLSKSYHNWYPEPLLMTPVDALDTMYLMGFKKEANKTREYIVKNLSFDKNIDVQNFEITIRLLGGLLSSYQITGDKRLLDLAEDLGNRLLPVFNSPTRLPYKYVNLKTGATRGEISNPAETGTLLIEFGTLSKLTNKPVYYDSAKRALFETYSRRSPIGLVGTRINVETGKWTNTDSHISAEIDSYYEYLLKCSILFDDEDCRTMWEDSIPAVNKYLADEVRGELWYGHSEM